DLAGGTKIIPSVHDRQDPFLHLGGKVHPVIGKKIVDGNPTAPCLHIEPRNHRNPHMPFLGGFHAWIEHQRLWNLMEIIEQLPVLGTQANHPEHCEHPKFGKTSHWSWNINSPEDFKISFGSCAEDIEAASPRFKAVNLSLVVAMSKFRSSPPGP